MSLILFILFAIISLVFIFLANYYRKLFALPREEFKRDEIVNIKNILLNQFKELLGTDEKTSYVSLGIGFLLGYIASHIGGIYTVYQNDYFFNSALIPAVVVLGLPYFKNNFGQKMNSIPVIKDIISNDIPFIIGVSIEVMAQLLFIYGMYHSLSFVWVILNYVGILVLLLYKVYSREKEQV